MFRYFEAPEVKLSDKTVDQLGLDHNNCKFSTDITDTLSAGQGKLDNNGFWEFNCQPCANAMQAKIGKLCG